MVAEGSRWDAIKLDEGDAIPDNLAIYDALIVMGGPMDVWDEAKLPWLATEKRAIRDWVVHRRQPFLGVCLGHQLLAEAIGGAVGPMMRPEVGVCDVQFTAAARSDPLFAGMAERFACLQWHGAEVTRLPPEATVTAVNEGGVIEAFRYGSHAFGLQFHVETTADTVAEWGAIPAYRESLTVAKGPDGLDELACAAATRLDDFQALARRIYGNLAGIIALARRSAA